MDEMKKGQQYQTLTTNLVGMVRNEILEGRNYLAVPMVMMVEGVLNGSDGPLFYPSEELAKVPQVWNMKPVVVRHPTMNGKSLSACEPAIIENHKVGIIMNTSFDGRRLKAEAWLEPDRLQAVEPQVKEAVEKGRMMEVSTGLFTENENKAGTFKGASYKAIARNLRPDHLAILPDSVGACSIADGAGLLRVNRAERDLVLNALQINSDVSHDEVRQLLYKATENFVRESILHIADIFQDYFIYATEDGLWRQAYAISDGKAVLINPPTQVQREVHYVKIENEKTKMEPKEENKTEIVNGLISEGTWQEADREFLEGLSTNQLGKIAILAKKKEAPADPPTDPEILATNAKNAKAPEAPIQPAAKPTDYLANLPAEIAEVLNEALTTAAERKAELVKTITENKRNILTAEQLSSLNMKELQAMAALAQPEQTAQSKASYVGQGPVGNLAAGVKEEEPLVAPVMNFERK